MWAGSLLLQVLNTSITAGIIIALVLIARLALKRAPKIFSYVLWGVVLFRLLCPISFQSPISLLAFINVPVTETGNIEYVQPQLAYSQTPTPAPLEGEALFDTPLQEQVAEPPPIEFVIMGASYVWLAGIAILVLYNLLSTIKLHRKLVGAVLYRDNISFVDHLATPFVIGAIRPRIYLPSSLRQEEVEYIICHEQTHIQRGDYFIKLVSYLVLVIHWFNPLVWVAFILAGHDMEMSCDESVLKKTAQDIRAEYSTSLLTLSADRKILSNFPLAFDSGNTKGRVKNIMKYQKKTLGIALAAAAVVVILVVCLIANPLSKKSATMQGGGQIVTNFDAYDTFSFSELQPTQTETYSDDLTFSNDIAEFNFVATWTRSGLAVEVGLLALDGKEYVTEVFGGSADGTIKDVPAGTYKVFLRNSQTNLEHEETTDNLSVSGAVAFNF